MDFNQNGNICLKCGTRLLENTIDSPGFPSPFITINQAAFQVNYNCIVIPIPLHHVANLRLTYFLFTAAVFHLIFL